MDRYTTGPLAFQSTNGYVAGQPALRNAVSMCDCLSSVYWMQECVMARGRRGGRQSRRQPNQTPGRPIVPRPSRRRRGRSGPTDEVPTAAPGSAEAPGGSSILGGGAAQVTAGGVGRSTLRQRNRGGPRSEAERERGGALRARAVAYDFRYVGSDLRWILGTTGASVAAVIALWAILRL